MDYMKFMSAMIDAQRMCDKVLREKDSEGDRFSEKELECIGQVSASIEELFDCKEAWQF